MDVTKMDFRDGEFDAIIDKGKRLSIINNETIGLTSIFIHLATMDAVLVSTTYV